MRTLAIFSLAILSVFFIRPISVSAQSALQTCIDNGTDPAICQCEASGGSWSLSDNTCSSGNSQSFTTNPDGSQPFTTNPSGSSGVLMNPLGEGTTVNSFLLSILNIITNTVGPVIVILMLVFVGFKFVTAQGAPAKIAEARGMLLWTLVGALILLGAKAIAMGIQATVSALSTG